MNPLGLVLFLLAYLAISARKLSLIPMDRPAAALTGAVAMVLAGVLTPEQAIEAVHLPTLLLLLGVMGLGGFLALDGTFGRVSVALSRYAGRPSRLLGAVVWASGLAAALLTNDAVCVLGAPLVVGLIRDYKLPAAPFLLALATGANTGSVGTLLGNPQNMLCAQLGGLSYRDYLLVVGPLAVAALAVNHALLWLLFRRVLAAGDREAPPSAEVGSAPSGSAGLATPLLVLAVVVACWTGLDLAWAAAGGFVAALLWHRRDPAQVWAQVDWSLLLFFSGLFVLVEGLQASGAVEAWLARYPLSPQGIGQGWGFARLSLTFLVGSNVVSNVPFILMVEGAVSELERPRLAWTLLAVASTFAGNLTLLGSVANVIVAEAGRGVGGLGFWEHLRVGLPIALATTALGTAWLWAAAPLFAP
jgi:Na+/H+ antiporter NhaD/arsenite permease-like protein